MNKLVSLLLSKAKQENLSDRTLCGLIHMDNGHFSRWKKNSANAPDPRQTKNRRTYEAMAKYLEISVPEALSYVLFPLKEKERKEIFLHELQKTVLDKTEAGKKLYLISYNSAGNEEILDLIIDFMKSYITKIKGDKWKQAE